MPPPVAGQGGPDEQDSPRGRPSRHAWRGGAHEGAAGGGWVQNRSRERHDLFAERGGVGLKFLVLLTALGAVMAVAWMTALPVLLTRHFEARTGCGLQVRSVAVNPFTGTVRVAALALTNPSDLPRRELAEVPVLELEGDLRSLWDDRWEIRRARLVIARLTVVTGPDGATNLQRLKNRWLATRPARAPGQPPRSFVVRSLELKVDRLVLADHSKARPVVREIDLDVHQLFEDVTDLRPIVASLKPSLAKIVVSVLPGEISRTLGDAVRPAAGLIKDTGQQAVESVKGLFEKLEEKPKP